MCKYPKNAASFKIEVLPLVLLLSRHFMRIAVYFKFEPRFTTGHSLCKYILRTLFCVGSRVACVASPSILFCVGSRVACVASASTLHWSTSSPPARQAWATIPLAPPRGVPATIGAPPSPALTPGHVGDSGRGTSVCAHPATRGQAAPIVRIFNFDWFIYV